MKRRIENLCWREIIWQRPFEPETVYELLAHLACLIPRGPVIWEARATGGHVRYLLGADERHIKPICQVFAAHGSMQFYKTPEHTRQAIRTAKQVKISHPVLSLNTGISMALVRAGLAALAAAREGEEVALQIILGPSFNPSIIPKYMQDPHTSWLQLLLGSARQASSESRSSAKEKAKFHGFHTAIRIGSSDENAFARIYDIFSALKTLESAGVRMHTETEKPGKISRAHIPWCFPLKLSIRELAQFFLLPAGEEELAGNPKLHPKLLRLPDWYRNPTNAKIDRSFALGDSRASPLRFSISPSDSLEHTLLLGPTGSGKSTAMQHLIMADINAGRSVLVIDPKADLVTDILARIPEARKNDVVVIDPSDPCPVGFNPFAFKDYRNPALIADAVLAVLKEIFAENWGIRSQDILSAALLTLAKTEGATLLWLPSLLTDEAFRQKITEKISDPIGLEPFWESFEAMRDSERRQEIAPVMNKLRQFLLRPGLRNVLGQSEPKFKLTDLFYKRRIVLVPLNKGIVGAESARLLGSLIVGLTWTLALSRASLPPERRHIVSVFIDELQDYLSLPTDFSDALAQARGLGLGITMAHQYRDQLSPEIRAGIDANARNKIVFGLNAKDAKEMAAMAPELAALDFMTLPRYQIYTAFQQNGRSTGWVQGKTLPPTPALRLPAELKAFSMGQYGTPTEEVEQKHLEIMNQQEDITQGDFSDASIGRRKLP